LTLLFEQPLSQAQARAYLEGWASLVNESRLTCFDSLLTTLDERFDEITNDFLDRPSSGLVEGLNPKIKVLKRRCDGIFSCTPVSTASPRPGGLPLIRVRMTPPRYRGNPGKNGRADLVHPDL
jgi:hypothetical protein